MAEVLSQKEIEALLSAMSTTEEAAAPSESLEQRRAAIGAVSAAAPQSHAAEGRVFLPLHKRRRAAASQALLTAQHRMVPPPAAYETYDFRRPDKLSKDHIRALQMLHENFAGYFMSSLAGYLRTQVEVDLVSVEQVPYDEYVKTISASLLNIVNIDALSGQAIFEMDFGILFSMLDRLLGGKGAAGKVVRDLTDIEKVLSSNVIEMGLNDLKTAWETVLPLDFQVASMETSSQFVQIVPGNDTIVLVLFEIRIGEFQGAMSLCIPYLLIKPILAKLSTQRWFATDRKKAANSHSAMLAQRLNTTTVPCIARLGQASLTVADLAGLSIGQVLPMQVCSSSPDPHAPKDRLGTVDLMIGEQVKFRGRTGLRGRTLAVQIEQVVAPVAELVAHREQSPHSS
ncbi:MAG: flagellar motor switch protein FliM [Janthinobacterium lividum]